MLKLSEIEMVSLTCNLNFQRLLPSLLIRRMAIRMSTSMRKDCWDNDQLPPPATAVYEPRGSWVPLGRFNTYVTGSNSSRRALVVIHDAFGASPQIVQGADRLATQVDALVLLPDLYHGKLISHDEFVNDPTSVRSKMKNLRDQYGNYDQTAAVIVDFTKTVKEGYSATSWGVFGLCWGAKIAVLAGLDAVFIVSGQTHPGGLDAEDAKKITNPHIVLASKDEPADIVANYRTILEDKGLGRVYTFEKSIHGWMGTRADLEDNEQKIEYERGYTMAANFFDEHM